MVAVVVTALPPPHPFVQIATSRSGSASKWVSQPLLTPPKGVQVDISAALSLVSAGLVGAQADTSPAPSPLADAIQVDISTAPSAGPSAWSKVCHPFFLLLSFLFCGPVHGLTQYFLTQYAGCTCEEMVERLDGQKEVFKSAYGGAGHRACQTLGEVESARAFLAQLEAAVVLAEKREQISALYNFLVEGSEAVKLYSRKVAADLVKKFPAFAELGDKK